MNHPSISSQGTSTNQLMLNILVGIVALLVIIGAVVCKTSQKSNAAGAANDSAVLERIKPVAEVVVAAAGSPEAAAVGKSGEQVVTQICSACHATGAMNAPKIGDKASWGPRIAQGYETLVKHALNGIRAMPARGGNPGLSDQEVAAAVAHMANGVGANFKAPAK